MDVLHYLLSLLALDKDHCFGELGVYLLFRNTSHSELHFGQLHLQIGLRPVLLSLHLHNSTLTPLVGS